jgi:hypothetical protein
MVFQALLNTAPNSPLPSKFSVLSVLRAVLYKELSCLLNLDMFTPLESLIIYSGGDIDKILILYRKGEVKAPPFLTGFTSIISQGGRYG